MYAIHTLTYSHLQITLGRIKIFKSTKFKVQLTKVGPGIQKNLIYKKSAPEYS
jgi:hypothetical protein